MDPKLECPQDHLGYITPNDATVDWCQLHLLLLNTIPTVYWYDLEHIFDLVDLHSGQCLLHAYLFLHS